MPRPSLPTTGQLLLCWLVLMTMTAVSLWSGDPTGTGRLPLWSIAVLLGAAVVKAVQILWVFLNLRRSTTTWKATFAAFLASIVSIVLGCAALTGMAGLG